MIFTPLEVLLIMGYVVLANSWAIFAISMNNLFHIEEPSVLDIIQCYLYNVVGFPLALWLAIYNTHVGRFDHHIKPPGCDEKVNNLSNKLNQSNILLEETKEELASVSQELKEQYQWMEDAAKPL